MTEALSNRAQDCINQKPSILKVGIAKCIKNGYDATTNPDGIINLGTAENKICDDLIIPKLNEATLITPPQIRYFNNRGLLDFRREVARFITERANTDVSIEAEYISILNGCSAAFCFLAFVIGGHGDRYLIPTPYFGMTDAFMEEYSGLVPIGVELDSDNMPDLEQLTKSYDDALARGEKVCGIVLINPHNPTGAIYPKDRVIEVLQFAKQRKLHVIVDEIYLLSVFEEGDFESCLSYTKQWPDPQRTHFIWGFSKDFAMSGSRCAMVYSQNTNVHKILQDKMKFHTVSGIVQMKLSAILRDTTWLNYFLVESRVRLQQNASLVMKTMDKHEIPYLKPRGTLFLWVNLGKIFKEEPRAEEETLIFNKMLDHRIYIPSSLGFKGTHLTDGYFRIVYAVPSKVLALAMHRFEKFLRAYSLNEDVTVEC